MSFKSPAKKPGQPKELHEALDRIKELEAQIEAGRHRFDAAMEAEELAKSIIMQSPAVLFRRVADKEAQLLYVSDNISQWGYSARDFLTEKINILDIVHPDDLARVNAEIHEYMERGLSEYQMEYRILTRDGKMRWVYDRTIVIWSPEGERLYNQGLMIDVTERKLAELSLVGSESKLRRILETAGEGYVYMGLDLVYQDVNQAYCSMLGYSRDELLGKTTFDLATPEFVQYLQTNRESLLSGEQRLINGELVAKNGHVVPVLIHANTLLDEAGRPMGNVAFVTDMTEPKKALALAGEVQKSLLPNTPLKVKGFDIAGKSVSCEDVGGDYFDFFHGVCEHQDNVCVTVGDVSGHGVDAALLMAAARSFLRARAQKPGGMAEIIQDLNRHLAADLFGSGRFMTLFALAIRPKTESLAWVRAGHDPALLYSASQDSFTELGGEGLPLAVDGETVFMESHLSCVEPGTVVAIGTDGIWEARNLAGEMFGKSRFKKIIRRHASKNAQDILNAVYDELELFSNGMKSEDDITLVIVKAAE